MTVIAASVDERLRLAKDAAREIGLLDSARKSALLHAVADLLEASSAEIVAANAEDLERGREDSIGEALLDRLRLDDTRVSALAAAVRDVAELPDPVGRVLDSRTLPNGLSLEKVAVPFGVVGSIYEARPNVTVDIASLALRSGNAVVLRGGSAALSSNATLVRIMRDALASQGVSPEAIQSVDDFGRDGAKALMNARGLVDVLVPRGSAGLIETVVTESTVPVIETGAGVVHVYLDATARDDWARDIVLNAKTQRPSVCNAVETVLVHRAAAVRLLPELLASLAAAGVTVHGDDDTRAHDARVVAATDDDWSREYGTLDLAVRVVDDLDEALAHIRRYSTHHTESIITRRPRGGRPLSRRGRLCGGAGERLDAFHRRRRVRLRRRGRHLHAETPRPRTHGPRRADEHQVARARRRPGTRLTA
ncbi:glutamate-5-semialdehyde dehydrogenase [Microbacterium testaceum]|nr:glutamate-5-semialdehyde dehydrogenase [Microbacterium testaceum]